MQSPILPRTEAAALRRTIDRRERTRVAILAPLVHALTAGVVVLIAPHSRRRTDQGTHRAEAVVGQMVRAVLDAAGLRDTPGLVAGSLTRSAGLRMYQPTRDLKYVAQLLGKRSRAGAANCIGLNDPVKRPAAGTVMRPDAQS